MAAIFKNAEYYCSDIGLAWWKKDPKRETIMEDSINPLIKRGVLKTFDLNNSPVFDEVLSYVPTPGHSHDHAAIILKSNEQYAIFSGDLMHNQIQVNHSYLASCFCETPKQAEKQRSWAMNWAADHQAKWFSAHFPDSSVGYITKTAEEFAWNFI